MAYGFLWLDFLLFSRIIVQNGSNFFVCFSYMFAIMRPDKNELFTRFLAIFSNFRLDRDHLFNRILPIFNNFNLVYGYFHKFRNRKRSTYCSMLEE